MIHPEHSNNEGIHAQDGSHVNVNRFSFPKPRELLLATLLAMNCVGLVVLIFLYRYDAQERDLDRYDDGQFITHDFADLKAQVKIDHELIQAYGLTKALTDQEREHGRPRNYQK